jgi:serine-type D-Ala-D-Ala carboxypeptidase/endopeptidase (penicillin-binding protein 4)
MGRFMTGLDRRDLIVLVLVPVLAITGLTGAALWTITVRTGPPPVAVGSSGRINSLWAVTTDTVLDGLAENAAVPTTAGLRRALVPALNSAALGPSLSVEVLDVENGTSLYGMSAERPRTPASTTKVLTAAAALTALGAEATLSTTVVSGGIDGEIVLVGGGDVLLGAGDSDPASVVGRAGLTELAARTAAALSAMGRDTVSLRLDDSLFSGPAINPSWSDDDVSDGFVAPVMALEVNEGRVGRSFSRQEDPALATAETFLARLEEQGITVTGTITRTQAEDSASVLAEVRSAALGELVEHTLTESDNTVAEALARLVAVHRGEPVTFTGAGKAVVDQIASLGIPTTGVRLFGGSGLCRRNAISAHTLTLVLALAADTDRPQLMWLLSGLPVAGASGTLVNRFASGVQREARGLVRAKTGSLTGVNALAGVVVDADGRMLAFAILADDTGGSVAARRALDSVATALADCGCR